MFFPQLGCPRHPFDKREYAAWVYGPITSRPGAPRTSDEAEHNSELA